MYFLGINAIRNYEFEKNVHPVLEEIALKESGGAYGFKNVK